MSQLRRRGGLRSGDFLMVKDTVRASRRRTSRRRSNTVPDLGPDGCGLAGRAHRPHLASVVVALVSILRAIHLSRLHWCDAVPRLAGWCPVPAFARRVPVMVRHGRGLLGLSGVAALAGRVRLPTM